MYDHSVLAWTRLKKNTNSFLYILEADIFKLGFEGFLKIDKVPLAH